MSSHEKNSKKQTLLLVVLFIAIPALLVFSNLIVNASVNGFGETPPPIGTYGWWGTPSKQPIGTPVAPTFTPTGTTPPVNDDYSNAVVISSLPYTTSQSTLGALVEAGEPPYSCGADVGATVWYSFTPASDGLFTAHTNDSNYDTVLHVFEDTGGFPLVVCSDDDLTEYDLTSRVTFEGQAGTTYLISIGGYNGAAADVSLELDQVCTDPNSLCVTAQYPSGDQVYFPDVDVKGSDGSEVYYDDIIYHGTWTEFGNIAPGLDYIVAIGGKGLFIMVEGVTAPGTLTAAHESLIYVTIESRNIDGSFFQSPSRVYFTYNNASVLVGVTQCLGEYNCPSEPLLVAASPKTVHIDAWTDDYSQHYYFYQPNHALMDGETISLDASALPYETMQINQDGDLSNKYLFLSSPTINRTYWFGPVNDSDMVYVVAPLDSSQISVFTKYWVRNYDVYWHYGFVLPSITMDTYAENTIMNIGGTFTGHAYAVDSDFETGEVGSLYGEVLDGYGNTAYEIFKKSYYYPTYYLEPLYYLNDALSNPVSFNELGDGLSTYAEFTASEPTGTWEGGFTIDVGPMGGVIGDSVQFSVTPPTTNVVTNNSFEVNVPAYLREGDYLDAGDGPDCGAGNAHSGDCSLVLHGNGTNKRVFSLNPYNASAGDEFTLSLYRKGADVPSEAHTYANIILFYTDGTREAFTLWLHQGDLSVWEHRSITVTAAKDVKRYNLNIFYKKASGSMWVDDISVTHNGGANLVTDPSFESWKPNDWLLSQNFTPDDGPACTPAEVYSGGCSLRFVGDGTTKRLLMRVRETGSAGDVLTFSIMRKGEDLPIGAAYANVILVHTDGTLDHNIIWLHPGDSSVWEQRLLEITAEKDYKWINLNLFYKKDTGTVWLDDISLLKPE